ncbi:sensor histidine kinase [Actomonas aquatica]|uniref:Oxygen sensor histidine kinase NreB n=1 Tax=Actomonas aquatica TaxID=2866162 RepID=A0ABZ1C3G8_9BACT|nr:sensor histidine kinase [Opitutus sp. WL0086]WRQ86247.1 two-component regulator propeller domain-containing protein [Opitutus sp. WL0086]
MKTLLRAPLLLLLLFWSSAVTGWAETFLADGYAVRVWQTEDGLPQNLVTSATQTQEGYLWFGTHSGLARFDGKRFRVFDSANTPALRDRRISALFEDAAGTLWIGHEAGGVTRLTDGSFQIATLPSGADNEKIIGLGSDPQQRLWAMHEYGALSALGHGEQIPSLIAPEKPGNMAWSRGPNGHIWVVENGAAARLIDDALIPVNLPTPQAANYVFGLAATADGGAWILCDNRVRKWRDDRWVEDRGPFPWGDDSLATCLELSDGTLAVGTLNSGLHLIYADGRPPVHLDRTDGLPQNWVRFLHEDREGTLWVGIGSAGLVSIHPTGFAVLNAPDQWQGCSVLSVAASPDGSLWIGTDGAGVYHYSGDTWQRYAADAGLNNVYIPAVAASATGEIWAGNFWWGGPYRLEGGQFERPPSVDETSSPVLALLPVPGTPDLLVGNREGLLRLSPTGSTWLVKSPLGASDDVSAVALAPDGTIWCGFTQGGLVRITPTGTTVFDRDNGLGSNAVHSLLAEPDGTLWIGTADHGLTRYRDGRFDLITPEAGLADKAISAILADAQGYLWLATHRGIQRVARADLHRCADGELSTFPSQIYDRSDGLPIVEFLGGRQGSACTTPDGRLWFANSRGLVCVDPAKVRTNPLPPPVVIESFDVDGRTLDAPADELPTALPPDHQRLEFRFAGLSYVSPDKVQFRYRLEGLDKSWVEVGTDRTASYSQLPAGSYQFHVIASNNDGLWNTTPATVSFTVAPFFWQTWWFLGGCTLLMLSAVAFAVRTLTRRRLRHRLELLEQRHALELERARIARDIHDDVGTSLTRISMLSQSAPAVMRDPERAGPLLARIQQTATDMTRALDEIVWAVDPRHDTLDSLVSYMGKFAEDFLRAAEVRCRLDLPFELPAWDVPSDHRHHLFLAFKEALNNALRHGGASVVQLHLRLQPRGFELVVQDNGGGFDPAALPERPSDRPGGGNGLRNMRQRLERIGGRCEVRSAPGDGTTVTFVVPVPGAPSTAARSQA